MSLARAGSMAKKTDVCRLLGYRCYRLFGCMNQLHFKFYTELSGQSLCQFHTDTPRLLAVWLELREQGVD